MVNTYHILRCLTEFQTGEPTTHEAANQLVELSPCSLRRVVLAASARSSAVKSKISTHKAQKKRHRAAPPAAAQMLNHNNRTPGRPHDTRFSRAQAGDTGGRRRRQLLRASWATATSETFQISQFAPEVSGPRPSPTLPLGPPASLDHSRRRRTPLLPLRSCPAGRTSALAPSSRTGRCWEAPRWRASARCAQRPCPAWVARRRRPRWAAARARSSVSRRTPTRGCRRS